MYLNVFIYCAGSYTFNMKEIYKILTDLRVPLGQ